MMIKIDFENGICLYFLSYCSPLVILVFGCKWPCVAGLLSCNCSLGARGSALTSLISLNTSKATGPSCWDQQPPRESWCRTYCNTFPLPASSIPCSQVLPLLLLNELDVEVHVVISDNFSMCFSSDGYFLTVAGAVIRKMKKETMVLLNFSIYSPSYHRKYRSNYIWNALQKRQIIWVFLYM